MSTDTWTFKFFNSSLLRKIPSFSSWIELEKFCTDKVKKSCIITYQDDRNEGPYIVECEYTFDVMKNSVRQKDLFIQGKYVSI